MKWTETAEHRPLYPLDEWKIIEPAFVPEHHERNETIFALGNGYIGMRGNLEEGIRGPGIPSVEGTYLNGFYESNPIHYPEPAYGYAKNSQTMLNVTDLKTLRVEVDGERFSVETGRLHKHIRELDMRKGVLLRHAIWESTGGKQLEIRIRKLVSLSRKHVAAIRLEVTPLNFDGPIGVVSVANGRVTNQVTLDDPRTGSPLSEQVLLTQGMEQSGTFGAIRQITKHTRFGLYSAMEHRCPDTEAPTAVERGDQQLTIRFELMGTKGKTAVLEKFISYHTSRDYPEAELPERSKSALEEAKRLGFEGLEREQEAFLQAFWQRTDVEIEGDQALLQGLRYNAFQLLQSVGRDGRTNIGAKGLSGEGYEGHYFWDTETFMLPFFLYTNPQIARSLLEYRYGILDKARERAVEMAAKGALYPWRTINGEETSAYYPAGTAQAHINADIIHGVKMYAEATGDREFLLAMGAEMAAETARYWADIGYYSERRGGRFCIDGVTGPDEYTAVVNNNAYTNLMARENLLFACETLGWMEAERPEAYARLAAKIGLDASEPAEWKRAADSMFLPYDEELGILAQDDTFLFKKKWDFANVPADRYPLLLNFHPLVIYRHQVLKQADVVLALFLQGDRFTLEEKKRNYDYYEPLTTHDSSLSPCIHSILAAELGYGEEAYRYFNHTARMDLDDINGNVKDGIHTASMAGSWLSVVCGFAGMRVYGGRLHFRPRLPARWTGYRFKVGFQGRVLEVAVQEQQTVYKLLEGSPLRLVHDGEELEISGTATCPVREGAAHAL